MRRDRWSRRELLQGGAGLALGLGLGACGVGNQEQPTKEQTERAVKAEIDGDLVYFNWSEYLEPKLIKAFEKQYGVKVRESNFDSMQGMMAKLRSGNRYDVIFPSSEWVDRLRKGNQLLRIDVEQIPNASAVYDYFAAPWYDPDARPHRPVRDVRQRDHLPRRQDRGHDGLVERHGQPVGGRPRLPARRLPGGDRRRQPRQRRRAELDRRGGRREGEGVGARPEAEDARLLDRRRPEHGVRQRLDPPRLERRRGQRPQPGRQARELHVPEVRRGDPARHRLLRDPGQRGASRGPR